MTAKTVTVTFVAPKHVGLTHDDYGIGSPQWPETVTYQGKQYALVSYENPLVDASLFTIYYVASDGERLAVDYEGSGYEGRETVPYFPQRVEFKQVKASDLGLTLSEYQLDWQDAEPVVDGVTYSMRSYNWRMDGRLLAVFASSEAGENLEILA